MIGFGLTDGENLERLWSYLGRFSKMTNPAHRIDTLSDALCYYSDQKCNKMGKYSVMNTILVLFTVTITENSIVQRMKKAFAIKSTSEKELEKICATVPIDTKELKAKLPQQRDEEVKRLNSISQAPGTVLGLRLGLRLGFMVSTCTCTVILLQDSAEVYRIGDGNMSNFFRAGSSFSKLIHVVI